MDPSRLARAFVPNAWTPATRVPRHWSRALPAARSGSHRGRGQHKAPAGTRARLLCGPAVAADDRCVRGTCFCGASAQARAAAVRRPRPSCAEVGDASVPCECAAGTDGVVCGGPIASVCLCVTTVEGGHACTPFSDQVYSCQHCADDAGCLPVRRVRPAGAGGHLHRRWRQRLLPHPPAVLLGRPSSRTPAPRSTPWLLAKAAPLYRTPRTQPALRDL